MFNVTILIPSLNPDETLIHLIQNLQKKGFDWIVVVDDGSGLEYADIFKQAEELGCMVKHHKKNMGKGAAIKTAIKTAIAKYGRQNGFITVDGDGQHLPNDIQRVAIAMKSYPNALILGIRDFDKPNVPIRSFLGNRITSAFFRLISGIWCPDTQTGLRGIPASLLELALSEEGSRYEYEMNFLMDAVCQTTIEYVAIETIYEDNNSVSHFRPIIDSIRVYYRFLRFAMASLVGFVVDYLLFGLLLLILPFSQTKAILLATVLARIGSGIVNFILNRYWSFQSHMPASRELFRYILLFLGQMFVSAELVSFLSLAPIPILIAKVLVDTMLFFISFRIQKNWVFQH